MSLIGSTTSPNTTGYVQNQTPPGTIKGLANQDATGVGVIGDLAQAPEVTKATVIMAMASIAAFLPPASEDDADVALASATAKLKQTMNKAQVGQIDIDAQTKRQQADAAKKKYDDAEKKIEDARDKMAHASIWDKIKLAFQYIGAIASILAGIATMAAGIISGVGALPAVVGGALLITSGLLMLTLAADQTVQMATTGPDGQPGQGMFQRMFTSIAEDAGLDPNSGEGAKLVQWGSFAVSTYLMVVALTFGIAGSLCSPESAASDAVEAGEALGNLIKDADLAPAVGTDVMEMTSDASSSAEIATFATDAEGSTQMFGQGTKAVSDGQKAGNMIRTGIKVGETLQNTANTIVSTTADAVETTYNYQASVDQSDADTSKSQGKVYEALNKMLDEYIDIALGNMKKASEQLNAVLDTVIDSKNDLNKSLTSFRFTA